MIPQLAAGGKGPPVLFSPATAAGGGWWRPQGRRGVQYDLLRFIEEEQWTNIILAGCSEQTLTSRCLKHEGLPMYYLLEPEVAGGWGERTVIDQTMPNPPSMVAFEYRFDGWLGDELLTTHPCFIVTERVSRLLSQAELSGYALAEVSISRSRLFRDLYPYRRLPRWVWMKMSGQPGKDDFGLTADHRLVVSKRALAVLKQGSLNYCAIEPYCE